MDHLHGAAVDGADVTAFQRLLRRLTLRTSARNQFACIVSRIEKEVVNALVFLALDDECELEAQITSDSVKQLGLSPGREVVALVKAQAVFLLGDTDPRTQDRNQLTGVISRIHKGPVSSEVIVDLPLARMRHITAVVTTQAAASLGLEVGSKATAGFHASSVILAILG